MSESKGIKPQNATLKKDAMVKALEKSLGVVTTACRNIGIDRATHYRWLEDDPKYKAAVQALSDVALDFAESKLHSLIQEGDTTATIFYLKTKGKQRGYIERQEVSTELKSINITIDGGSTNI
jgi:transcriptional regulator of acetoin/glycerol metabolism